MGSTGKKSAPPKQGTKGGRNKPENLPAPRAEDDDYEDGDIATPKRDRYGNDDEPL